MSDQQGPCARGRRPWPAIIGLCSRRGPGSTLRALSRRRLLARWSLVLLVALSGCALGPARQQQVDQRLVDEQEQSQQCPDDGHCAAPSLLLAAVAADRQQHQALQLEQGADALRLRLHLIRAARERIDLQTFIFRDSVSSQLLLVELLAAARRGVEVRLLVDQLLSFGDPDRLAHLALAHRNLKVRVYNPTFREASTQFWEMALGVICCFRSINQRMHNKLFIVDNTLAIIGGRNYDDSYFDLDPDFLYYDRELLISGPTLAPMTASFEEFWRHEETFPVARLADVGRSLLAGRERQAEPFPAVAQVGAQLAAISADADDADLMEARFLAPLAAVDEIEFVADQPAKVHSDDPLANAVSLAIGDLLAQGREQILLQTPYLVLGSDSRRMFKARREQEPGLTVRVSTNSLAATDAIPVYALSYKYKKRYLRELGFDIYEFMPQPNDMDAMVDRLPELPPPRLSMHAKSLVIDGHTALVGTHNFDPRSDRYNTEAAVIIRDRAFAGLLSASILGDIDADNSWRVARRERGPAPFYRLSRFVESVSTALPLFDLWPFRYASSFELNDGCPPLARDHPGFYDCHIDRGDFPEVDSMLKRFLTRLGTAFGAPLLPIL
ncbi:MAG: phosphatidylserine/phosphatidylglycerophosphate/cardiolipin synthase family protein [Xanthomonadales bacterium]|nr:phosphatidylserine/phosphatidylglycerophosphate/cardiolipin synthase family protein [Xanthomonadales bacterium]